MHLLHALNETGMRQQLCALKKEALLFLLLSLCLAGCRNSSAPVNNSGNQPAANTAPPTATPGAQAQNLAFDGGRAYEHVRRQVEIGPRPAGSAELGRAREYIMGELKSYGLNVTTDEWTATTPVGARKMINVTAELAGESPDLILITSHYDTKYFKNMRFVGANDGGSSTGAVMELARIIAANSPKPRFTYRFVFFDGEEAFCAGWEQCKNPDGVDNTYGSRRYVSQLQSKGEASRVRAMILLDMIGATNLEVGRDTQMSTPWLVDAIWQTAREQGHTAQFLDRPEDVGGDDHEPFLRAGIDAVDIIQLSTYDYWHTEEDTLDKVSPQSLKIIGDVVLASLPRIEQKLLSKKPA
jgi:glutaminyl-peptide cyclotransferase